jgi:hypothetical protein
MKKLNICLIGLLLLLYPIHSWAQVTNPGGGAGGATAANQTNGTQKTQVVDSAGNPPLGLTTDAACAATDATPEGMVCLLKQLVAYQQVLGQTTMSASVPVVVASNQSPVPVIATSGSLITDYTSGATATVLSTTAGTVLTSATVLVMHIRCWNQTGSAATVTITDTAGVNIIPPAFSIPALTVEPFLESAVGEEYTGIKWSAGTGAAILCKVKGRQ